MHVGSNGRPVNNRCSAVPVPSGRIALVHSCKFHNNVVLLGSQAQKKIITDVDFIVMSRSKPRMKG